MKNIKIRKLVLALFMLLAMPMTASADEVRNSVVGVEGYDLVTYHTNKNPQRGTGNYVAHHNGVNYLFISDENRATFEANPDKYLPAYGGYCAFGVAVGKKFISDADVWEIVDGRLYLNLDNSIKALWVKDIPGNIAKADANWKRIRKKSWQKLNR